MLENKGLSLSVGCHEGHSGWIRRDSLPYLGCAQYYTVWAFNEDYCGSRNKSLAKVEIETMIRFLLIAWILFPGVIQFTAQTI